MDMTTILIHRILLNKIKIRIKAIPNKLQCKTIARFPNPGFYRVVNNPGRQKPRYIETYSKKIRQMFYDCVYWENIQIFHWKYGNFYIKITI